MKINLLLRWFSGSSSTVDSDQEQTHLLLTHCLQQNEPHLRIETASEDFNKSIVVPWPESVLVWSTLFKGVFFGSRPEVPGMFDCYQSEFTTNQNGLLPQYLHTTQYETIPLLLGTRYHLLERVSSMWKSGEVLV